MYKRQSYIKLVADELKGSNVTPCCVIGFPFGTHTPEAKAAETSQAVAEGAREVDMVVNIGAVKSGDWSLVARDIKEVVSAAGPDVGVKVILEVCLLTDDEKTRLCIISKEEGSAFVKTSTGYSLSLIHIFWCLSSSRVTALRWASGFCGDTTANSCSVSMERQ